MSNEITLKQDQYIQDLLQQLGELEADKAELEKYVVHRERCDLMYGLSNTDKCTCGLTTLIQKHAKK